MTQMNAKLREEQTRLRRRLDETAIAILAAVEAFGITRGRELNEAIDEILDERKAIMKRLVAIDPPRSPWVLFDHRNPQHLRKHRYRP